jgi:hypothetical protein
MRISIATRVAILVHLPASHAVPQAERTATVTIQDKPTSEVVRQSLPSGKSNLTTELIT